MQTFSFAPPLNLNGKGKWLLGVSLFDCINSVFNITNENDSFSVTIPGHWQFKCSEKNLLKSFELHVKEVRKRGNKIKIVDSE